MPQAFLAWINFYLLHLRNLFSISNFLSNIGSCDLPSIWLLSASDFMYVFLTFIICVCLPHSTAADSPSHTLWSVAPSRFKSLHMIMLRPISLWFLLIYINFCTYIFSKCIFKTHHPFRELLKNIANLTRKQVWYFLL